MMSLSGSVQGGGMGAMKRPVPRKLHHEWTPRLDQPGVFDCPVCGQWTANLPLYRQEVCDAKDRRKGLTDRRS